MKPPETRRAAPAKKPPANTLGKANVTQCTEKVKWTRALESALDGVLEAESGDLGLIERNLVSSATEMLVVAAAIRRRLRK